MKDFQNRNPVRQIAALLLFLGVCYLVAWSGAQVSPGVGVGSSEWYNSLQKPSWNPPAWVFGPVWSLLYTMMGIAAWLVWKEAGFQNAKVAMALFFTQLILNGLWSWIFFGMQETGWAFIEIMVLLVAIIVTTITFYKKRSLAGWLMLPYILWVAFATFLNYAIWTLN